MTATGRSSRCRDESSSPRYHDDFRRDLRLRARAVLDQHRARSHVLARLRHVATQPADRSATWENVYFAGNYRTFPSIVSTGTALAIRARGRGRRSSRAHGRTLPTCPARRSAAMPRADCRAMPRAGDRTRARRAISARTDSGNSTRATAVSTALSTVTTRDAPCPTAPCGGARGRARERDVRAPGRDGDREQQMVAPAGQHAVHDEGGADREDRQEQRARIRSGRRRRARSRRPKHEREQRPGAARQSAPAAAPYRRARTRRRG